MISFAMIVRNEEKNLKGCLESIKDIADEIIVLDTGSTDNTTNIAFQYSDKVYSYEWNEWEKENGRIDFARARNYSIKQCTQEWIFVIDADERLYDHEGLIRLTSYNDIDLWQINQVSKYSMVQTYRLYRNGCCEYEGTEHETATIKPEYRRGKSDLMLVHLHKLRDSAWIIKSIKDSTDNLKKAYYLFCDALDNGQTVEAINYYKDFEGKIIEPLQAFTDLLIANEFMRYTSYYLAEAKKFYDKVNKLAPRNNSGYIGLSNYYLTINEHDKAEDCLNQILKRNNIQYSDLQNDKVFTKEQIENFILKIKENKNGSYSSSK